MANSNLHVAKENKNDEFYTQLTDIEKELHHYKDYFKDKIIFLNCDDPEWSNFWKYFALNFNNFKLKKLISTHYDRDKPTYKLEITQYNETPVLTPFKQNGDFRSDEAIEILKEADIIITNPPFSLFREYIAQLMEYNKKFLVIGNKNAIANKEIFPLIKENKIWLGITGPDRFMIPNYEGNFVETKSVSGLTRWFTNLQHAKRNEELILFRKYNPIDYPKYDNYNAINVNKVTDIPEDYYELMGVPITFLDKYNPKQFEIITLVAGNTRVNAGPDVLTLIGYSKNSNDRGGCGLINNNRVYSRIIIKRKVNT